MSIPLVQCDECGDILEIGAWPFCKGKGSHARSNWAVIGDECDVWIRHGLCNTDGSPRRFRSKTEIKRAANERGWIHADDTPGKPYRVAWSGRRKDGKEVNN